MDQTNNFKSFTQSVIIKLKDELKTIRTGQANPALLENLVIEAYAGTTKLKLMELASILTEGPSAIVVQPFDPSIVADVEKSILKSPLGLTPQVQGTRIIVRIPALSQEQREKFTKLVSQMVEEKKGMIRNQRDEVRKGIKNQLEKKEIREDDKFRLEKEIDELTTKAMEEMGTIKEKKEQEIMQV